MNFAMRELRRFVPVLETLEERNLLSVAPWAGDLSHPIPVLVAGSAAGTSARVTVLNAVSGEEVCSFLPYDGFTGGVRVALGDINGDGAQDIITAAGVGGGPHVKVFSGLDGALLRSFFAYDVNFRGGVNVASGDVNGDGKADIITGAGAGGSPHVRVFSGADSSELRSFLAYHPNFRGGVNVAAGDVNGDGKADIVTGAGAGGGPHVRVFSGGNLSELLSFYAYDPRFAGGVSVAAGNVSGDGRAEIVTGAGAGGGPHVRVLNGLTEASVGGFFAFDSNYRGGVTVGIGNGQVFSGGIPNGSPMARAFNTAGAVQRQFTGLGADFQNGMFVAAGTLPAISNADDAYENNNALAQAANLGTLTQAQTINLHLFDAADWFRFNLASAGASDTFVRIEFQHARGDIDLGLYNASGTLVRTSDSVANSEQVSLNGLAAGPYYVKIYGYQGVQNSDYSLTVNPGSAIGGDGGLEDGPNVLYVNFDGATISRNDLTRWAAGQWNPSDLPGGAANGVTVNAFFAGRSDREQIISGILNRLQTDLSPFGITVRRHTGLAVENQGATTLFAGRSNLTHPHVACDVDFGNDNRTDVAFIGEENWGNVGDIVLAMSDVFLHEAGHTFGLYHVQTVQNGTSYPESMGLRYSTGQNNWLTDTSFVNRTFIEFRDADGNWHGPGGGQSQNSYQVMLANFGATSAIVSNPATVDASHTGALVVTGTEAADQISVVELANGEIELSINGVLYTVLGGLERLVIDTGSDLRDLVQISESGNFELLINPDNGPSAKLSSDQVALWNGSLPMDSRVEANCDLLYHGALDGAFSEIAVDSADAAPMAEFDAVDNSAAWCVSLHRASRGALLSNTESGAKADPLDWENEARSIQDIAFALDALEDLLENIDEPATPYLSPLVPGGSVIR